MRAVVGVQGEDRLRAVERNRRVVWILAHRGIGRAGGVVGSDRMVGHDELHVRLFRRNDLAHALDPHRAVHVSEALHFHHQVDLAQGGIPDLDPVETFRRSQLLCIEVLE